MESLLQNYRKQITINVCKSLVVSVTSKIKTVLLHLSDAEHSRLKKMKEELELSWEKFLIYLSLNNAK